MDGKSDYGNPYLFTGRRVDILDEGSLKIQYNRNRYYDYYTGRWLTLDPLGVREVGRRPAKTSEYSVLGWLQYFNGTNLYQYVSSNPVGAGGDSFGLYNHPVHKGRTCKWAYEVEMCFYHQVSTWANQPDKDDRMPVGEKKFLVHGGPGAFGLGHAMLDNIARGRDAFSGLVPAKIWKIAYWHFPGGDLSQPVVPGGPFAWRQVGKGIKLCDLKIFAEGLHQLQDSYSHQSGGRPPPVLNQIAHSRDRYGYYWEWWTHPRYNPIPNWLDLLISRWSLKRRNWALQQHRMVTTALSHDADDTKRFATDFLGAERNTKLAMDRFMKKCPCIKAPSEYAGKCSICKRRSP
jgi:RHS repeat-associated protein